MQILKFYGTWCNPCSVLENVMSKMNIEYKSIDIDENEELTDKYNVRSVPTVIIADNEDKELERFYGVRTEEQIKEILNKYENI